VSEEAPVQITDACTGCGACVGACPVGAITLVDGVAVVSDACIVCSACVSECPEEAIVISESAEEVELSDYKGVLVYAEQRKGKAHPVAYELLGKGRELAETLAEPLYACIIGKDVQAGAGELVARGADRVYVMEDPALEDFRDDPYTDLLSSLCEEIKPSIVLIGATAIGRSLGPRTAARLKTGLTADCTGLDIDPETGLLLQTRPAYGGNIMATIITPNSRPQLATVRYKVMVEVPPDHSRNGEIINRPVDAASLTDRINILGFEPAKEEISIVDADIVVSGGKGLKEPKGFELIADLAQALGGAVGASRPTVDEGWIDYRHQVGLSGRTVRPQLYMACGISGAVQHLAGMKTSDVIIALNKDREAPIFGVSTFGAVGDLYEVIPILIEKIKEHVASA